MLKKALSVLMVTIMLITMLPINLVQANALSDDSSNNDFSSKDGDSSLNHEELLSFEDDPISKTPDNAGIDNGDNNSVHPDTDPVADDNENVTESVTPECDEADTSSGGTRKDDKNILAPVGGDEPSEDIGFEYDDTTGTLTISGSGIMSDYASSGDVPWQEYKESAQHLLFDNSIEHIGNYAFSGFSALQDIVLPTELKSIGVQSFANCSALESIMLPNSIESIGYRAFYNCSNLSSANIPLNWIEAPSYNGTNISTNYCGRIFEGCNKLTSITVPNGMTAIPSYGLCYSDYLTTINLPDTITDIKNHTFYGCSKLQSISIPNGVTQIGRSAFCNCYSLSNVSLPEGLKTIAVYSFYECKALQSIHLPDTIESLGYQSFYNCVALESVNIPLSWNEAPSYDSTINTDHCGHIFEGCKKLTTLSIPEGIEFLPSYGLCYSNCLQNIIFPNSITEIKNHTFYGCKSLNNVVLPESIKSIGRSAFNECRALSIINIPQSITELSPFVFYNCTSLATIHIPDGVSSIGFKAFYGCSNLVDINIPKSWSIAPSYSNTVSTDYCGHIFENCNSLKKIVIPSEISALPSYALCYSNYLEEITLHTSTDKINNHTFYACSRLKSIEIPEAVCEIGKSAFCGCSALSEVRLPSTIKTLPAYAFNECKALQQIHIPDSVEKIGYRAFYGCENLTDINIPKSWNECPSATSGSSGTSYQGSVFGGCKSLDHIVLPDGLSSIPDYGFCNCNLLKDIYIPLSVNKIGNYAFYGCSSLLSVDIPKNISEIPKSAFGNCSSLLVVNMPKSVSTISQNSFSGCNSLNTVNYAGNEDEWKNVSINSSGNTSIGKTHINYNFIVDYQESDFIGTWEGEYDGNSGSTIVRRHFVAIIDSCRCDKNGYGVISGINTISPSAEASSQYDANGSYYFSGTVNINTGVFFLQGHTWIEYPKNYDNFLFVTFDGILEAGKISISGINDETTTRTFEADLINSGFSSNTTVVMTKDKQQFDLLHEKVEILKTSGDIVTIIVTPDWKGHQKGKIILYQDSISVENTTGVFLDINVSSIFETNKSLFVSLIDANGNTVDTKKLKLKIVDQIVSRSNSQLSSNRITVYQNNNGKYKASKGSKIEYSGVEYITDAYGVASLPNVSSGSITVSKSGYISRTITSEQLEISKNVYLEAFNDNGPVVTAVWVESTDVLHDSYPLSMTSKDKTTIKAEVEWGKFSYGSIKLWQDGKSESFSGDTLTMVISDKFDTSGTITLIATDSENHKVEKTLLIQNGTVNQVVNSLDGIGFSFNDSIDLTIPDNIPLIGGINVGAGLKTAVPVSIIAEDGKIYLSAGAQFFHSENKWKKGNSGWKKDETKRVKGFINNVKEAAKDNKKLLNLKKTYKDALKPCKGKFGVEADFSIIGFAEGTFDANGHVTWLDGGLYLNPSVSVSYSVPFTLIGIPMFFEAGFSAEAEARFNISFNEQAKNFIPNGELKGTIALSGGVGVGVKKVLYASGGLEGSLIPDWKINVGSSNYFTLKAKLKAYAKAGLLIFEGKKTWDLAEKTLIEYPSKRSLSVTGALLDDYDFYDYSNYSIKDLSYLDESSTDKSLASVGASDGYSLLRGNIYRESTSQYAIFENGTALAVWLDSESSNINSVCLYYSFFDGSNWSVPEQVYNDGTLDNAPMLVESNGQAYLVWQNATKSFDANSNLTLDGVAKDFDISVAVFDSKHVFTTTTFANDNLDMQPVIFADGDNTCIAWINNSDNDWFGNNTHNSIIVSQNTGTGWTDPQVLYSNLNSIDSLAIDYNSVITVAYCLDTDGDIKTTDDLRVYENGIQVGMDDQYAASPQYFNHKLYWYSDNSILSNDFATSETSNIPSDNYQLLDVNGTLAAVFTVSDGLYSSVVVSYFNSETGSWNTSQTLVDNHSFVGAFSADVNNNGNIAVIVNNSEVIGTYEDENPYGTASLLLFENENNCDISISEPLYDEAAFCANESMSFDFDITNNGTSPITGIDVVITDESGKVLSSTYIEDMIVPGESLSTSASYTVEDSYVTQKVTIAATPNNASDSNLTNNSQQVSLSFENLCVENITTAEMESDRIAISADIVNYGYQKSGSITVKLVKNELNGTVVSTKTIDSIESLDMQTVSFEVNDKKASTYFIVIESEGDMFASDNSDFILINTGSDSEDETPDLLGDVDGDGVVTIIDATYIQRKLASLAIPFEFNDVVADTDEDGTVSIIDATMIQRWLANLQSNDNIGKPIAVMPYVPDNPFDPTLPIEPTEPANPTEPPTPTEVTNKVFFEPNGGTISLESKTVVSGEKYGELPIPIYDYHSFDGWFTQSTDGELITPESVFTSTTDVTLYAHWTDNPTSDWVLESEVPEGAKTVSEKWTYDYTDYKTSESKTMTGYTLYDTKENGWNSYGSWSSWSTTKATKSDSRDVQTKTQYFYDRYRGTSGNLVATGPWEGTWSGIYCGTYQKKDWSDTQLSVWSTQTAGGKTFNLYGVKGDSWYNQKTRTMYRYRDRTKKYLYYFKKTENRESETAVTVSTNISNIQHWVRFIEK